VSATGSPAAARAALADAQLRRNLGKATSTIRAKRDAMVEELPDWEALREAGAAIKARAMATLPKQLERLEASVSARAGRCTGRATPPSATRSWAGLIHELLITTEDDRRDGVAVNVWLSELHKSLRDYLVDRDLRELLIALLFPLTKPDSKLLAVEHTTRLLGHARSIRSWRKT
jgi:L-lactate dehydrogenase complex protein LldF